MSTSYQAVGWNRQKKHYDAVLLSGVLLYLAVFVGVGAVLQPDATAETMLIRGLGTAAFLLLHITLSIGPLCRLDPRFLPLLYNRRHMGVCMFMLGLMHGAFALVQFHALGDVNPFVSLLSTPVQSGGLTDIPFQPIGLAALLIFFLMAATSHDFWLANLSAPVWKRIHMGVYWAYALLIAHVMLGVLQSDRNLVPTTLVGLGMVWILGIHLLAASKGREADEELAAKGLEEVLVGELDQIPDGRARVVCVSGERIAVFRYGDRVSAISNACQHQNGPLGEGRIIDGLVTCPWHGFQYDPASGASPEPFHEKVPTFNVRIDGSRVYVDPKPNPPGTYVEPARAGASS